VNNLSTGKSAFINMSSGYMATLTGNNF
jgi:hypothetical protein